jgi:hypothetical protein
MKGFGKAWREAGHSLDPAPPDSTTESTRIFRTLFLYGAIILPTPAGASREQAFVATPRAESAHHRPFLRAAMASARVFGMIDRIL